MADDHDRSPRPVRKVYLDETRWTALLGDHELEGAGEVVVAVRCPSEPDGSDRSADDLARSRARRSGPATFDAGAEGAGAVVADAALDVAAGVGPVLTATAVERLRGEPFAIFPGLAFQTSDGHWVAPASQFVDDGSGRLLPGLLQVLRAAGHIPALTLALHLNHPFDGESPSWWDLLAAGEDAGLLDILNEVRRRDHLIDSGGGW